MALKSWRLFFPVIYLDWVYLLYDNTKGALTKEEKAAYDVYRSQLEVIEYALYGMESYLL